jgi:hypothetical protein
MGAEILHERHTMDRKSEVRRTSEKRLANIEINEKKNWEEHKRRRFDEPQRKRGPNEKTKRGTRDARFRASEKWDPI